ncbi:hypothetical protein [Piscinibacter koreensis]|uniref:Uncharacterized protein n=1 Tax=Piscinibacter koreensis TaxID=2742824 RepID=A0A7Y6NKG8_9BURK|nr:hypothetical protein [Schlegelella koreensis]NUZ04868.1 hypothetical protein [Schlegelella koreensis]
MKRLTKQDISNSTGTLNPVGHVILAFPDDAVTGQAVDALREARFEPEDILVYKADEATPRLRERVRTASEAAGFGYEITLMKRYLALAEQGSGWLIVFAPTDDSVARLLEVAKRFGALCAVRYHRLANEDLL